MLMRGIAGSGKSTLAKQLLEEENSKSLGGAVILSTDNYHMEYSQEGDEGIWKYVFKKDRAEEFHRKNQLKCSHHMSYGTNTIIIDNTNTRFIEMKSYVTLALLFNYDICLMEPNTEWANNPEVCFEKNTHNVPLDIIKGMLGRYESSETCWKKINGLKAILDYYN